MNVRIRGIYTTALTELLRGEHDIVSASPPIRERFDESFPPAVDDVTIRTTTDRLGVGLAGDSDGVSEIRSRLQSVGRDTLDWDDPAPRGAVFVGEVSDTLGSGAVVDLGDVEGESVSGFLPYDRVEGYVDTGDRYRVQIATPAPPWSDDRPSLGTELRVPGGLLELRRGGSASRGETARMAEILPVDPVDGWVPRWPRA
ncbi:MAG: RNA-binding protein, partial [Natronomonas sp.]